MAMVACVACCVVAGQKAEAAGLHLNLGNAVHLCLGDGHHHKHVKQVKHHHNKKAHQKVAHHDRCCAVQRKESRKHRR